MPTYVTEPSRPPPGTRVPLMTGPLPFFAGWGFNVTMYVSLGRGSHELRSSTLCSRNHGARTGAPATTGAALALHYRGYTSWRRFFFRCFLPFVWSAYCSAPLSHIAQSVQYMGSSVCPRISRNHGSATTGQQRLLLFIPSVAVVLIAPTRVLLIP